MTLITCSSLRLSFAPHVLAIALALSPTVVAQRATTSSVHVTGVRLDEAFALPGANATGLVVSVRIDALEPNMSSDDFVLALLDPDRPRGHNACLALRFLDGSDPSHWVLLDDPSGSLARSYHSLVDAKKAVVNRGRKMPLAKAGRYELAYFISTDLKEAALAYTPDAVHRPDDAKRHLVETFKVPAR
jgi:hypothetical protein